MSDGPMTRSEVQARYDAEVAKIRATDEHPQVVSMALNAARRWLEHELDRAVPDASVARLGDQLRHNIAEAERLRLAKIERENREAREKAERHRRDVSIALDAIKGRITASISEGSIPAPMRLPRVLDNDGRRWDTPINTIGHRDYSQWHDEMETWASREGLVLSVVSDHDGAGMESWWNVVVKPADIG